jgi:cyclopropane fatty-acyl-phospholipid synthase-like methyltransferase
MTSYNFYTHRNRIYEQMKTQLITSIEEFEKLGKTDPFTSKIIECLKNGGKIIGVVRNGILVGVKTHYIK